MQKLSGYLAQKRLTIQMSINVPHANAHFVIFGWEMGNGVAPPPATPITIIDVIDVTRI